MRLSLFILILFTSWALACELTPELDQAITQAATKHGLETAVLSALFWQESRYCHTGSAGIVTSPKGALGIGQLMPGTALDLEVDPLNLEQNIDGAARYLATQRDTFNDWSLALAAYNAGPGAVERYGGVPPYDETQTYVEAVLKRAGLAETTPTRARAFTPTIIKRPWHSFTVRAGAAQ